MIVGQLNFRMTKKGDIKGWIETSSIYPFLFFFLVWIAGYINDKFPEFRSEALEIFSELLKAPAK